VIEQWFIERGKPGKFFQRDLEEWERLKAEGWVVSVLLDRKSREIVALGFLDVRGQPPRTAPHRLTRR